MKQIYNKETHEADEIKDNATPPEGWTDKKPKWVMYETWDYDLDDWGVSFALQQEAKTSEISQAFDNEFKSGYFYSDIFGIDVDLRRTGEKNDLQNVEGLIDDFENLEEYEKYYVGYSETTDFLFTLIQLQDLKIEMIQEGRRRFVKKRLKYIQVEACTTEAELEEINW